MTFLTSKTILGAAIAAVSAVALAAPASAGDLFGRRDGGSVKDAPAEAPKRRCDFSMNIGATSDYVFRGLSQNLEDPAAQGGVDATCGMFYTGVWASGVDFYPGNDQAGDATVEVDFYAGIKPTWGPLTFDLGVIYYWYPGANDGGWQGPELDYVELKAGASGTWNNFSLGGTLFWSPDYTLETGNTITLEGTVGYTFRAIGPVTPSVSALIGTTQFLDTAGDGLDYVYWNAGFTLAVDKFSFDFRYWDTDSNGTDFCADKGICDERFVFTAKVALP
ncbi:MAG: TorF family putative porin [Hyphomicrobiaceae bacterium]